jgi:uncharacterized protein
MDKHRISVVDLWIASGNIFQSDAITKRLVNRLRFMRSAMNSDRARVAQILSSKAGGIVLSKTRTHLPALGFFVWPFLDSTYSIEQRFQSLVMHADIVSKRLPWLNLTYKQEVLLLDLSDRFNGLRLVVEDAPWFVREGCVNFSLHLFDSRLITLCFTLTEKNGQVQATIGSIQGNAQDGAVDMYKTIATKFEDLRPRDLLIKSFRVFAQALGVENIVCVSDENHIRRHAFFGSNSRDKLQFRYDLVWQEHGGQLQADGNFHLTSGIEERPILEVPAKKRSRYKRRLEMFGAISKELMIRKAQLDSR